MSLEKTIKDMSDEHGLGWNQSSILSIVEEFLEEQHLEAAFYDFIEEKAKEKS